MKISNSNQTTAPQVIDGLKVQIQNLTNVNVKDLPTQMSNLLEIVDQLELQVQQLEQIRSQFMDIKQKTNTASSNKVPSFWRKNLDYGEAHKDCVYVEEEDYES